MARNGKGQARREVTSCGALPWRIKQGGSRQVLLIKQFAHSERWGVPKGHLNEGESLEECALREVREETGLQVRLGPQLPDVTVNAAGERKTVKTWFAQAVGSDEPNVSDPDSEVAAAAWFDIDHLPELVTYQRPLVQRAVDLLRSAGEQAIADLAAAPVR